MTTSAAEAEPEEVRASSGAAEELQPVQQVMLLPGNSKCFDCDIDCSTDPWVSINHGAVICIACSGEHRSLGVHVSFVRSLMLDDLKDREVQALLLGGNERFQHFLEDENCNVPRRVWLEIPIEARYFTPAADLYRRRLRAQLEGGEVPDDLQKVVPPPPSGRLSLASRPSLMRLPKPVWTPDTDAPRCQLCQVYFSVLERRHHCRRCGRCVCGSCSPPECMRPIPEMEIMEPCRHCLVCSPRPARTIPGLTA